MRKNYKYWLTGLVSFLFPSKVAIVILRLLGHRVGVGVNLGFSLLLTNKLLIDDNVKIGHFNYININRLVMFNEANIGRLNIINGPLSVLLSVKAAIGNGNKITRGAMGVVVQGPSLLRLGKLSKITSNHRIDCTCSISIGSFTTIAGVYSQFWTHGYIHLPSGPDRYRIDGSIQIGNNVSVGSGSIITAGVKISDDVMIGAGTTVAKSIVEAGLYVSSNLRRMPNLLDPNNRDDLIHINSPACVDNVYKKIGM